MCCGENVLEEDIQSIEGHMQGGIPEIDIDGLDEYWKVFPGVRKLLFESDGRPGFVKLKVPITNIKTSIFDHHLILFYMTQVCTFQCL